MHGLLRVRLAGPVIAGAAVLLWTVPDAAGAVGSGALGNRGAIRAAAPQALVKPAAEGQRGNPRVVPLHPLIYGELSALWWKWGLSIPADRNPITDPTGAFCGEGQFGPVWFLEGTFGDSLTRSCTIPRGKLLFMPVYTWIFGSGVFDCDPTVPGVPCDVAALRATAASNVAKAQILRVKIDGVEVENVFQYRAKSPWPFAIFYPENSVVGVPAGIYYPQVSDGYWLLLNPLAPGHHTIEIRTLAPGTTNGTIDFTLVYNLLVR